ncbi:MAG: D-aminoacylase [Acidobacteria bacterium]|nr:MAG: D-aminoacylase [Acidobacteriota bacterium]REJ99411.1 MAG: D-aminoacylase [Acidobacteriota bacterium]
MTSDRTRREDAASGSATHRVPAPLALLLASILLAGCSSEPEFDLLLHGALVYDGSGEPPRRVDVALLGDRIAAVGELDERSAREHLDLSGLALAPGFVNMLSWATSSLLVDPRSGSDVHQGVTLEVFGEGISMGPLAPALRESLTRDLRDDLGDPGYEIPWNTLGEYLEHLEERGVAPNVASFVGATTVRIHELGYEDRAPDADELERMRQLVAEAMREGAMGVGSSLIYAPAFYAETEELIELARVAGEHGGGYISHMRSEGARLVESVDELIRIAREAGVWAEIYHLKAAGRSNWDKLDQVIARVEEARAEGLDITADMYTYVAGATGLNATMPPWVQEGGFEQWTERLRDPAIRARVEAEMLTPTDAWENMFLEVGSPENILLIGFRDEALRGHIGKTLAEVAAERGTTPEATAIDLVLEDESRVESVYFMMSEDNVRRQVQLPWMSFGSDAGSMVPEGVFLRSSTHPRAYGNFARLLGRYVRDEGLVPLEEAIRRLTSWPAENLGVRERGRIREGWYADLVAFDPAQIQDHATFAEPHQLATGVRHVWVNGTAVLQGGELTGATPGRVVRGPGWTGWAVDEEKADS